MKRPTFLWVGPRNAEWKLLSSFSENYGFELIHIESFEELKASLSLPHLFLTFINTEFMLRAGSFLKTNTKSLVYHVALSDRDSIGSVSRFYEQGFSDALMMPIPFTVLKSRIFLFLDRWLQRKMFPAGTHISPKLLSHIKRDMRRVVSDKNLFGPDDFISPETFREANVPISHKEIILGEAAKWSENVDSYFKKVVEPDSRIVLIREMEKKAKEVTIWTRGQRNIMKIEVASFNDLGRLVSFYYPMSYSTRIEFARFLSSQVEEVLYCNFDIGDGRFFFSIRPSEILFRDNRFEVFLPDNVFRVQRREELRIPMLGDLPRPCNLYFGRSETQASIFDLSAGGMRLQSDVELLRELRFRSDRVEVKLTLEDGSIDAFIQKKWKKDQSLGFEFVGLSTKEREKLRLFVFENVCNDLILLESKLAG